MITTVTILKKILADAGKNKKNASDIADSYFTALLAAFILWFAGQILNMEQSEISVIKSRGAGKRQLLSIYFIQSGKYRHAQSDNGCPYHANCQILGSANAFLEFVSRQALETKYYGAGFLLSES